MTSPKSPVNRRSCTSFLILLFVMLCMIVPSVSRAANYSDGVFQLDDPGGKYSIRLTFDGSQEPLPLGYEVRSDVYYFTVDAPYTDAVVGWQVAGDLFGSQSVARNSSLSGTWTAISANPFRMVLGNYYRLLFTVNDPATVSGHRSVYFYFALGRPTYPPAIDQFTATPVAIAPAEMVYFSCDAHDTGTLGSEELIFRLDVNGDGNYDTSDQLGFLIDPEDDPFRGMKRAEFSVKYNNLGIYRAYCQVENSRQETVTSEPLTISVSNSRLGVVGRPNDNSDLETAVIPPDQRFPATYHLSLKQIGTGSPLAGVTLMVSIDSSSEARLDSGVESGSTISIVTDAQGEAEFTYAFLDDPPNDAPIRDRIVIESVPLGLHKTVEVSVGLKPQVRKVSKSWDSETAVPRTLGLRMEVVDGFRPGLNLEAWIAALYAETGKHLGFAATVWWLNRPDPNLVQWINDNIKGFTAPPDDVLYTNGRGWLKKVNGQYVFQAIDQPKVTVNVNSLPAITLTGEGLHLFEATLVPVLLPEEAGDSNVDYVRSAVPIPAFFGADVYGAESVFESLVCSFSPTEADQFLLKSVILDCPLLAESAWVGTWAGAAIPEVLMIVEVADLVCNFMQDNYFNVGAALAGKYLSKLDGMFESGELNLTDEQFVLLKTFVMTNTIKKSYDAVNDAEKHFGLAPADAFAASPAAAIQLPSDSDVWPADLNPSEVFTSLRDVSGGIMSAPQLQGHEIMAILSAGTVTIESMPQNSFYLEGGEVDILLFPAGTTPTLSADAGVELFRLQNAEGAGARVKKYQVSATGEELLLSFSGDELVVDRGANGSEDERVDPVTVSYDFLKGDVNLDGNVDLNDAILALQMAVNAAAPEGMLLLPWAADVNQDRRIRLEEAIYILRQLAAE